MTHLGQWVRAILRNVWICVRSMNRNGNVSSCTDRAHAWKLQDAAKLLRQSAEILEATARDLRAPEDFPLQHQRCTRWRIRYAARKRAISEKQEVRKKVGEALRLIPKDTIVTKV